MPDNAPRAAFYISGHGFGHAARMAPVIHRLATQGVTVFVRSGAAPKFFADVPGVHLHQEHYDVGAVQLDGLNVDVAETLARCAALHAHRDEVIAREAAFIRQQDVRLIVGDIVPIAFAIAAAAGIPAIAASHFTWDWIYEPYIAAHPRYTYLREAIRADYAQAALALQMPFAHDFSVFPAVEPIPLIVRPLTRSRAEIRAAFNVPDGAKLAVLSMGGMAWGTSPLEALRALRDWVFVLPPDMAALAGDAPNFRAVPPGYAHFHDLTAASDLVIAKAGGVTVSECIAYRVPLIYTFRENFREDELLRPALETYAHARFFEKAAFEQGAWIEAIEPFMAEAPRWRPLAIDGAAVMTAKITAWLD